MKVLDDIMKRRSERKTKSKKRNSAQADLANPRDRKRTKHDGVDDRCPSKFDFAQPDDANAYDDDKEEEKHDDTVSNRETEDVDIEMEPQFNLDEAETLPMYMNDEIGRTVNLDWWRNEREQQLTVWFNISMNKELHLIVCCFRIKNTVSLRI